MNIDFHVTQEDIDKGVRYCETGCAIARAVKRQLQDEEILVKVSYTSLILNKDGGFRTFRLPQEVSLFVGEFDAALNVTPFDFSMNIELPLSTDTGFSYQAPPDTMDYCPA